MADSHVITALARKYAQLMDRLRIAQADVEKLRLDIGHVEATIRLFRAEYDMGAIPVKRLRRSAPWLRKGQYGRNAIEILREFDRPMEAREVALEMMRRRGITDQDEESVKCITNAVRAALKRFTRDGALKVHTDGFPQRWSLIKLGAEQAAE